MSYDKDLGQESPLKRRREELGLSQREVASAVNVSVQTISNWETGRYKEAMLTLPQVKALCQIMRWTVEDLPEDFGPQSLIRLNGERGTITIPRDDSLE